MSLLPRPRSQRSDPSAASFLLGPETTVVTAPEAAVPARLLAEALRTSTGYAIPVETVAAGERGAGHVVAGGRPTITLGIDERLDQTAGAYRLTVTAEGVDLVGSDVAGVLHATQTLRQLLPPANWAPRASAQVWEVAAVVVDDAPRFAYRGVMLDVARHFFTVAQVQRFIDQLASLKLNHLHLHLSDDQGWRLEIAGWPELTGIGAATAVGGGEGGFYTAADYRAIVDYAADRSITVVPEIDVPGHTNAALAAYPELNADGVAREPYTGTEVGFSSLDIRSETTYAFLEDVFGQLARRSPRDRTSTSAGTRRSRPRRTTSGTSPDGCPTWSPPPGRPPSPGMSSAPPVSSRRAPSASTGITSHPNRVTPSSCGRSSDRADG
jgi:hexosaminidase